QASLLAAALNVLSSMDILLSEALILHLHTMELYSRSDLAFESDLDKNIDTYHQISSGLFGNLVITYLLTLALELFANIQILQLFTNNLDISKELEEPFGTFELGDYNDMAGLHDGRYVYDSLPSGDVSDLLLAQHSDNTANEQAFGIGNSNDEAMEIEEDTEDNSGSKSDMAMD
ncbi:hypothetical protein GGI17_005421, partial [Coemansia sp. S146]